MAHGDVLSWEQLLSLLSRGEPIGYTPDQAPGKTEMAQKPSLACESTSAAWTGGSSGGQLTSRLTVAVKARRACSAPAQVTSVRVSRVGYVVSFMKMLMLRPLLVCMGVPGFESSFPLAHTLGGITGWLRYLHPHCPHGRPRESSKLLLLA